MGGQADANGYLIDERRGGEAADESKEREMGQASTEKRVEREARKARKAEKQKHQSSSLTLGCSSG